MNFDVTLYEFPPTRSQRAKWVLEELEIEYSSHIVNLKEGQQNSENYRAIHPLGLVPALKIDGYTLFESTAIVMQLIDQHPDSGLAPPIATPARAKYYQWCVFACAELDPPIIMFFDNTMRPGTPHDVRLAARGRKDFEARSDILSKALGGCDYLLETGFSGADILIGHSCFMATYIGLPMSDYPVLEAYYNRLQQRPAFQRAYSG